VIHTELYESRQEESNLLATVLQTVLAPR
jgi:hypothetical protein